MSGGYSIGKQYELYLSDESRKTGFADEIWFPSTKQELLDALDTDVRITIQGARTGLDGLAVPTGGRIVNLSRLTGVTEEVYLPDGTIALNVLAGTAIETLKKYPNHFFPPVPSESSSTIGACIATKSRSIFSGHYGTVENCVEKIDSVSSKSGQRVIVSAVLKLIPKPKEIWAIAFFFREDACARTFTLEAKEYDNVAVNEYMDFGALSAIVHCPGRMARLEGLSKMLEKNTAMVYLELHDEKEDAIVESAEKLLNYAMELGCQDEDTWSFCGEREVCQMREIYHAAQEGIIAQIDRNRLTDSTIYGVGAELEQLVDFAKMRERWTQLSVPYACFGNVCTGNMRLAFMPNSQEQYNKARAYIGELHRWMRR